MKRRKNDMTDTRGRKRRREDGGAGCVYVCASAVYLIWPTGFLVIHFWDLV